MKLEKNSTYIVRLKQGTEDVLMDLDITDGMVFNGHVSDKTMENSRKMRSHLYEAFMASGLVNNLETSRYHLEISSIYEQHSQNICSMLNYYGPHARILERYSGYVSCLKGAEKTADLLTLIDTINSMFRFEDVRIVRGIRDSVNRLANYETTNLSKTIGVASRRIENIELIEAKVGLHALPEKLQEVAKLRFQHPETSLRELGETIPSGTISKPRIDHRVHKINGFAEKLREKTV